MIVEMKNVFICREMIEVNGRLKLDNHYSGVHVQLSGNCREWREERTCEGGGDLSADVFVNILEQNWHANLKIINLFAPVSSFYVSETLKPRIGLFKFPFYFNTMNPLCDSWIDVAV